MSIKYWPFCTKSSPQLTCQQRRGILPVLSRPYPNELDYPTKQTTDINY